MSDTMVLSKILHIRETEKKHAQKAYQQSLDFFEQTAMELYELLKKKELAEVAYEEKMHQTTTLEKLKEQFSYIEKLNAMIMVLQEDVQRARMEMETKQSELNNAHIEMKKFEKLIENRRNEKIEAIKKNEKAMMDEVAIHQFLNRKIR
ncbi:flagellar export protein FliJ [Cerasibacillus sp. JNUCC 74]|uniref:flagellar export protein FliJ n=1 Tax=Virgibacillus proomii TaxID=84407 RepID=UPI000984B858|nr:flagellar export protein FliJ [Virgibacillus proomii]